MFKRITGTWFEFTHHNVAEGKYWDPIVRRFTEEQWREKVREMKSVGMKYIAMLASSLAYADRAESYFDTDIYPFAKNFTCKNPIEVILDEADKQDLKVFVSVGYYGDCYHAQTNMQSPEVTARAFKAMEQLVAKFGHHRSFYGWYLPDEIQICPRFPDLFIDYTNRYAGFARQLQKDTKILIGPYGTNKLVADDLYAKQLEILDCDIIAYQDEVGVKKSTPDKTGAYYEVLRKVHDKAGRAKLFANVELFDFEGDVYRSPLIPATADRVEAQINAVAPFVDEIFCYQYMGMMNKPGTIAYCGHPDSIDYYISYMDMVERNEKSR